MNIFFVPNHIFDLNHCVLIFSTSAHPCYYPYPCSYLYFDCLYIVYTSTGGGGSTGSMSAPVFMVVVYSCVARGGFLVGRWGARCGGGGGVHVLLLYEAARG